MPDALNYRVGPQPGGPLFVSDVLNNREGPQAWESSKYLNEQSYEEDWPKRPSDQQLQKTGKKTHTAITPVAEAVRVPAHLVPPGSPKAKQLCHFHV